MARPKKTTNNNEESSFDTDSLIKELKSKMSDSAFLFEELKPKETKHWLSTGSTILDMMISNNPNVDGGIPSGRLSECSGFEATGKSLLGYMVLKDCQEKGGLAVLIDTERAVHPSFLKLIGLSDDKDKLLYLTPETIEEVFQTLDILIKHIKEKYKDRLCAIVWDSIAATPSKEEAERSYDDKERISPQARAISSNMRKCYSNVLNSNIVLLFLNQLREKVDATNKYADNTSTPGGKAVPFYSSVRLRLKATHKLTDKTTNDEIGATINAFVKKNRMGPPHRSASVNFYFSRGIIDEETWLDVMKDRGLVKKENAQVSTYVDKETGEIHEFKNREFIKLINENETLKSKIKQEIKNSLFIEQDPEKLKDLLVNDNIDDEEAESYNEDNE